MALSKSSFFLKSISLLGVLVGTSLLTPACSAIPGLLTATQVEVSFKTDVPYNTNIFLTAGVLRPEELHAENMSNDMKDKSNISALIGGSSPGKDGFPSWSEVSGQASYPIGTLVAYPNTDNAARDSTFSIFIVMVVPSTEENAAKDPSECALNCDPDAKVPAPVASCEGKKIKGCIVQKRTMQFTPHKSLKMPISLNQECAGVACGLGLTCGPQGQCVSENIDPSTCAEEAGCRPIGIPEGR